MIKKFVFALLLLAMAVAFIGCGCTYTDKTTGVTTKTNANCLKTAQDLICNPPAAVMSGLEGAAQVIKIVLGIAVPQSAPYLAALNAQQAVIDLQTGACTEVTNLNALIATLQSSLAQQAQAKLMAQKAIMSPIDVQAILAWKSSAGK